MDPEHRCNSCGKVMEPLSQAVAASCYHLFCTDCAQKLIEADEPCPLCEGVLSRNTVKLIHLLQPASKCTLLLCGQTPQVVVDTALTAINFYVEQQRLNGLYTNHKLQQRMDSIQAQCRKKLTEMQNAYQSAKQKCIQIVQQKNAIEQDNQELQQKYAQKAMQARKLQDMFKALQAENEELKRRLSMRGGVGNSGGSGRAMIGGGGALGSGRAVSPFGPGTNMVTTVRQTKSVIELSPVPGSMNLLTGHGSAVVGSGGSGQHGGNGGGGFFGGSSLGLRAGTAPHMQGGRASGGMLGPSAAGGMGGMGGGGGGGGHHGGSGAGMRFNRGMGGLGSPGQAMMSL